MEDERRTTVSKHRHHEGIELKSLVYFLNWVCVDQSNLWRAGLSWSVFFSFAVCIPILSHFLLACPSTCDADHTRPYHVPPQISLSLFAALSFVCLSRWARKYGLRRFLFFDRLFDSSEKVRHGYKEQLQVHIKRFFILPSSQNELHAYSPFPKYEYLNHTFFGCVTHPRRKKKRGF